ncbi:uncharacterized protein BDR25DRAFT_356310 [Lindgomyces ingoldianus]|uniref:Uncharacterized protein n=1 Tax=Lindgomyces ingoldianus TaxID=673940 RepID=A0ACB6QRE8_9PLEO|nr:uncharacterized protein BDR25DRAFT_356310 [Lindgomyces ingoldianus]KAF2469578.1 hypothetical protein BDR25DRAFT_356310 [Lindgomyces ingoldianus]
MSPHTLNPVSCQPCTSAPFSPGLGTTKHSPRPHSRSLPKPPYVTRDLINHTALSGLPIGSAEKRKEAGGCEREAKTNLVLDNKTTMDYGGYSSIGQKVIKHASARSSSFASNFSASALVDSRRREDEGPSVLPVFRKVTFSPLIGEMYASPSAPGAVFIPPHPGAPPQPQYPQQPQGYVIPPHPGAPPQPQNAFSPPTYALPPHPGAPPQPPALNQPPGFALPPHNQHALPVGNTPIPSHPGEAPIPPDDPFSHIRDLPIFPLSTDADLAKLGNAIQSLSKQRSKIVRNDVYAPMAFAGNDISTKMRTQPMNCAVYTRYATPKDFVSDSEEGGIIVDVVETRGKHKWMGNAVRLRMSREGTIMVRDKWHIKLREGTMWNKSSNWKPVESVKLEVKKGEMVELGMVGRWERWVAVEERTSMWGRFEKEYKVPKMPEQIGERT